MFKDVFELMDLIDSGEDIEKIVKERLSYLKSDEYRRTLLPRINFKNDECPMFYNGFITKDDIFGFTPEKNQNHQTSYIMDDEDIYYEVVKRLIDPKDRKTPAGIYQDIIDYFKYSENAKYKEILDYERIQIQKYFFEADKKEIDDLLRCDLGMSINCYKSLRSEYKNLTPREYVRFRVGLIDLGKRKLSDIEINMRMNVKERLKQIERTPLSIKDIKGLGVGKCVEHAMLTQNIFSFLGYNMFFISGGSFINNSKHSGHSWNVLESNGNYFIKDVRNYLVDEKMEKIKEPYDLLRFGEMNFKTQSGTKLRYKSVFERYMDLKRAAKEGKIYRTEAKYYFERLEKYKELNEESVL